MELFGLAVSSYVKLLPGGQAHQTFIYMTYAVELGGGEAAPGNPLF